MSALSILLCFMQGCGSFFFRTQQSIPVVCANVPGANFVAGDGEGAALSGETMSLDRRKSHAVEVKADGYATQIIPVESTVSVWRTALSIVMNASWVLTIVGIPIPFLGIPIDISAGAWRVLEPTRLRVELVPDGSAPMPAPALPTAASWPTSSPTPSTFCSSCGARAGTTTFCTSCGGRLR